MQKTFLKLFVLCAINALLIFSSSASAQLTFSTDFSFVTGSGEPMDVVCTDLNSDGKPDMAISNITGGYICVFLNTTTVNSQTPTFTHRVNFSTETSTSPFGLRACDFNTDGKPDLLISSGNSQFCILLNNTPSGSLSPSFSSPKTFTMPSGASDKGDFADFNMDGKPDIVMPCNSTDSIAVLLNTTPTGAAEPTFSLPARIPAGINPAICKTSDLNNDGKPDIIVSFLNNSYIHIYINTTPVGASVPSFTQQVINLYAFSSAAGISTADLNLDGKEDVIFGILPVNIGILINNTAPGASTASFQTLYELSPGHANWIASKDINGDNIPDIISGDIYDNTTSISLNTTSPNATTPSFYPAMSLPVIVAGGWGGDIVDMNGDGAKDIVYINIPVMNLVTVKMNLTQLGTASVNFGAKTDFSSAGLTSKSCIADFNLDGKPDIASSGGPITHTISFLLNNVTPGAMVPSFGFPNDVGVSLYATNFSAVDLNTDRKPDIVYNEGTSGTSLYFKMNITSPGAGSVSFGSETSISAANPIARFCFGDFNMDGRQDLAYADNVDSKIYVRFNSTSAGGSTASFDAASFFSASSVIEMLSADINFDGKPDILLISGGNVSVLVNTIAPGGLAPSFAALQNFSAGSSISALTAADFNGDGKPDVAACNLFDSTISVIYNTTSAGSSTVSFSSAAQFSSGAYPYAITHTDYNGDGITDILCCNKNSGTNSVFINTATPGAAVPSFATKIDLSAYVGTKMILTADVNMDGKQDIVSTNDVEDKHSIFLNLSDVPLPVELASFTAKVTGENVKLQWSTISELNNKGFDIERKSEGKSWEKINFIGGSGTSNVPHNYTFTDGGLGTGSYNYRLKQIDYNGNFKYHELSEAVIIGVPLRYSLEQNYPNPFNPATVINYQLPYEGFVSLKIYDVSGREVKQLVNEVKQAGYYAVQFNAQSFASGIYFYKIQAGDFMSVKKMVLVK
jgi:hypothetical protein